MRMEKSSSSKRRRKAEENDGEGIDMFSNLPESVLLHILSFLPTKTSVATTSLVSRRWRHLWQHLQIFHFHFDFDDDSVYLKSFRSFTFFVNAVLALRKSRDIRKLHLDCAISEDDTKSLTVPPSLKRLKFSGEDHTRSGIYLEIDVPGLQYLSITTQGGTFDAAVGNLQNVVEADIDVFSVTVLSLLRALSGIKHLVTTKCLPVLDFPEFHCLLHLELFLPSFNLNFLLNVLQKCHVLQVLTIHNNESTRVPDCLVSHLDYICIKGYQGFEDELAFAEYILRNGLVLKKMIIFADISLDEGKKYRILKRLSDIPRGSVKCQLQFD